MSKSDVIAFIPARGGSKRVPGKNLKMIGGKPLLRHAVDSALDSGVFSQVIVSSDDEDVKGLVSGWDDVSFHEREEALANDMARVPEVVHAFLSAIPDSSRPKSIGVLLPPCPFRTGDHVKEGFEKFCREGADGFLVSVTRYEFPPQFALKWTDSTAAELEMLQPEVYGETTRSQSVEPLWHPNGAFYFCNVKAFLKVASFYGEPLLGYEMLPEDSIDIDWPHQFEIADLLYERRKNEES